jgi:GDP/UDP-N,N'-diacetylbacillosamine 2-epimerase (hydrolysing)
MKICVVTGTRAEYGLLRWVMEGIVNSTTLQLQIVATGMHLSPEFGMTVNQIEQDGFQVDRKIEMLLSSDSAVGVTKSTGLATISFAEAFNELSPDLIILLGDRYELLAASTAALIARIPVAHIHGGETTEGAFDEAIRHSITKMSHLHFVAAEIYKKRVIQLGEQPKYVFNVGGLGIDNIKKLKLLGRKKLEREINYQFSEQNLLITFHPVTLENNSSEKQIKAILKALNRLKDIGLIFTMPNSDTNGRIIFTLLEQFCANRSNAVCHKSLGQLRYLSCLKYVDAVVGNSSSGLLEVPSFKIPTVNIGDRQKGRLAAKSVINCHPSYESTLSAISKALEPEIKISLRNIENPYGNGGASAKIVEVLETINLDGIIKKKFHDF